MLLLQEGVMALDAPITTYLPQAPTTWKAITVRHLLTHTSGIPDRLYDTLDLRQDYTEDQLLAKIAQLPLDGAPGQKFAYCDAGYVLLGIAIHKVTGQFYGDLLAKRVFGPLEMRTARIIGEEVVVPNRAAGYRLVDGALEHEEWVSPSLNTTADGSVLASVLDLARWDVALANHQLLTRASLEQMWTPVRLNGQTTYPYGFGWEIHSVRGHRVVEHAGAWQGFTGHIVRFLDDSLTVVVLTNLGQGDPRTIAHGIAGCIEPALGR
jgi:CubicO group peptidase (beta-lactamase class C family)